MEETNGYVIIEIQTSADGTIANLIYTESSKNKALSVFYEKCGYAALSTVCVHTVCIIDIRGNKVAEPVTFEHGGAS